MQMYWKFQGDLFIDDNILYLNERIVVPLGVRSEVLKQLHVSHLGIEKTKSRPRTIVYWPRIDEDIENMINRCNVCQKYRIGKTKDPMLSHDIPYLP